MKTLLVAVNSKYIHSSLSVWYLRAVCPEAQVFECTINQNAEDVYAQIMAENPDVLGFSCYIYNISFVDRLMHLLRESAPQVKIVLGGPEVSPHPEDYVSRADHIITGEGEQAFCRLIEQLSRGEMPEKIIHGTPQVVLKSPYTTEYFEMLNSRIAYFESSRGCPFSCAFCLSGASEAVRFFDLEDSLTRLVLLANSGTKTIKFVDRTFNCNAQRAYDMWEFIIDSTDIPPDVCFHFEIGADLLEQRHIELLVRAPVGKIQLEIGLQSFNESTLRAVQRKTDVKRLVQNIKSLVELGNMHIHTDLIIGLPYEDAGSFKDSFNATYKLGANMLQVGFLKLLYGSVLREKAAEYGIEYESEAPYVVTSTAHMSNEEIKSLILFEDAVERVYNSGRFTRTLKYVFEQTGMSAFDIFFGLAEFVGGVRNISLEQYTELMYRYFCKLTDESTLRDIMCLDALETNNSGNLPECLKIYDVDLKRAKAQAEAFSPRERGVKRAVQILYSTRQIAFCDYLEPHRITGRYTSKTIKFQPKEESDK